MKSSRPRIVQQKIIAVYRLLQLSLSSAPRHATRHLRSTSVARTERRPLARVPRVDQWLESIIIKLTRTARQPALPGSVRACGPTVTIPRTDLGKMIKYSVATTIYTRLY